VSNNWIITCVNKCSYKEVYKVFLTYMFSFPKSELKNLDKIDQSLKVLLKFTVKSEGCLSRRRVTERPLISVIVRFPEGRRIWVAFFWLHSLCHQRKVTRQQAKYVKTRTLNVKNQLD
jgi:hypothetical protein